MRSHDFFQLLEAEGFAKVRVSGSHFIFRRSGRGSLPVPVHDHQVRPDVAEKILTCARSTDEEYRARCHFISGGQQELQKNIVSADALAPTLLQSLRKADSYVNTKIKEAIEDSHQLQGLRRIIFEDKKETKLLNREQRQRALTAEGEELLLRACGEMAHGGPAAVAREVSDYRRRAEALDVDERLLLDISFMGLVSVLEEARRVLDGWHVDVKNFFAAAGMDYPHARESCPRGDGYLARARAAVLEAHELLQGFRFDWLDVAGLLASLVRLRSQHWRYSEAIDEMEAHLLKSAGDIQYEAFFDVYGCVELGVINFFELDTSVTSCYLDPADLKSGTEENQYQTTCFGAWQLGKFGWMSIRHFVALLLAEHGKDVLSQTGKACALVRAYLLSDIVVSYGIYDNNNNLYSSEEQFQNLEYPENVTLNRLAARVYKRAISGMANEVFASAEQHRAYSRTVDDYIDFRERILKKGFAICAGTTPHKLRDKIASDFGAAVQILHDFVDFGESFAELSSAWPHSAPDSEAEHDMHMIMCLGGFQFSSLWDYGLEWFVRCVNTVFGEIADPRMNWLGRTCQDREQHVLFGIKLAHAYVRLFTLFMLGPGYVDAQQEQFPLLCRVFAADDGWFSRAAGLCRSRLYLSKCNVDKFWCQFVQLSLSVLFSTETAARIETDTIDAASVRLLEKAAVKLLGRFAHSFSVEWPPEMEQISGCSSESVGPEISRVVRLFNAESEAGKTASEQQGVGKKSQKERRAAKKAGKESDVGGPGGGDHRQDVRRVLVERVPQIEGKIREGRELVLKCIGQLRGRGGAVSMGTEKGVVLRRVDILMGSFERLVGIQKDISAGVRKARQGASKNNVLERFWGSSRDQQGVRFR